jgi:leader peptidase (prepilin peptidase) / N-methyltransferase
MIYFLSAILGLVFGSFANVCIFRLPKAKSIAHPRSFCPHCKKPISPLHNIPLISYLWLQGRSSCCHKRISWRYPTVEALVAGLFLFQAWMFPEDVLRLIFLDLFSFFLFTISVIDYDHFIIPDELSLSLLVMGLLTSFVNPFLAGAPGIRFLHSFLAALGGGLLMLFLAWAGEKIFKKEALGGGDVKLIAATAAILGWQGIYGPLMIGSLLGGLVGLALLVARLKKPGQTIPFGPFLSVGAYVTALFPNVWPRFFYMN